MDMNYEAKHWNNMYNKQKYKYFYEICFKTQTKIIIKHFHIKLKCKTFSSVINF